MRCWQLEHFGLDGLKFVGRPDPAPPGSGKALVRIRAVSLNYRDWLMVQGLYNPKQKLPLVPCSDGAGEVIAVGEGVTRVKPGDRVCPIFAQGWLSGPIMREYVKTTLGGPLDGTLREFAEFDAEGLVQIPDHLTDAQAASLPCAAVTAWNAIVEQGKVQPGQIVVIQGTGGVATFAMLFARMQRAATILLSSSDEKLAVLGGEFGINYSSTPEWGKRVRELTGGIGADHVIDVGGAKTLAQSIQAVRMGGVISVIGQLGGGTAEINIVRVLMENIRLQGVMVGSRETFESMNRAIAEDRLEPILDAKQFGFTDVKAAFDHLSTSGHVGKITLRI